MKRDWGWGGGGYCNILLNIAITSDPTETSLRVDLQGILRAATFVSGET